MNAQDQNRRKARWLLIPSVVLLFLWMAIPLLMTIYYSFQDYNLLMPGFREFAGFGNYRYFFSDPSFIAGLTNTLVLVGSVLFITVVLGTVIAVLIDQPFFGRNVARILIIAPFFIMPTVNALIWKNLIFHPVNGLSAYIADILDMTPIDWFAQYPLFAIIVIVSWQWMPFAILILMTALQSMDQDQVEAARIDGAGPLDIFRHIAIPHLQRPLIIVVMIETIFLLTIFAEIYITTGGGPGTQTTNLAYLIFQQALLQFDVGMASAGGIIAVILANIVAVLLIRVIGKTLAEH